MLNHFVYGIIILVGEYFNNLHVSLIEHPMLSFRP